MHYLYLCFLSHEKIELLVLQKVKKTICNLTSVEALLERIKSLSKHYLANLHMETHLLFSVGNVELVT